MKRTSIIAYALLFIGFVLRIWNLTAQSVWWDEAYTVQTVRYGWNTFWQLQTIARHPPLYFLSVGVWGNLTGWSEFSLRFLSVIYGTVGIVLLYKLCARLLSKPAGLWTLAVASVNPALIAYSQEGRMYAFAFMLACAMLYFAPYILNTKDDGHAPRSLERYAFLACESLLLLTHYFALPFVAAFNLLILIHLIRRPARLQDYLKWIVGQILAAVPVLVWLVLTAVTQGGLSVANEPRPDLINFLRQVTVLWATGVRDLDNRWSVFFVAFAGFSIFVFALAWVKFRHARNAVLFGMIALSLAFIFANIITSFHPRYVLIFSIPLFVLLGAVLSSFSLKTIKRNAWSKIGAFSVIAITSLTLTGWNIALDPQYVKDDARGVAAYLRLHSQPGDVILVEANDYTLTYYEHGLAITRSITAETDTDIFNQMSAAIGSARHVWLAHWTISTQDLRGYRRFLLEQSGRLIDWTSYQGYELYEYEMNAPIALPHIINRTPLDFKAVNLVGWSNVVDEGDGAIAIAIAWQRSSLDSTQAAKVALRLLDPRGFEVSAVNVPLTDLNGKPLVKWPADQTALDYYVLPLPPGTPPLTYTLSARVYDTGRESVEQVLDTLKLSRRLDTSDPYRTLMGYRWQTIPVTTIVTGLSLEAFSISPQKPKPLDQVDITLRWRKTASSDQAIPRVQLEQDNRVWLDLGSDLFERNYPVDQWQTGEMVIEHRQLIYPPIAGGAQLQIGQGDHWTSIVTTTLDTSSLNFAVPVMQHKQSALYDNFARLLGYDLSTESFAPDRPLTLTLYWQALNAEPITAAYTVFTQLIAPDGHLIAQHDGPPQPIVNAWVKGEVVVDRHALKLIDPAYRGPATLIIGWYNSATIERVKTAGGDPQVVLQTPIQINAQ